MMVMTDQLHWGKMTLEAAKWLRANGYVKLTDGCWVDNHAQPIDLPKVLALFATGHTKFPDGELKKNA